MPFASLPSPDSGVLHLGPFSLRAYGLLIALGVIAAVSFARRRWAARGGDPEVISTLAVWCVPAGLIGARLYHVITDYELYRNRWGDAFKIWDGGLGIWGGIALGVVVGLVVAQVKGYDKLALLDTVAPALPLAQAIGRFGNWFNQELFGRPTTLPWGLRIDPAHRPSGYQNFETFHPTFLYESLWNLFVVGLLLFAERRFRLKPGRLFALYVAGYTFGRFWIELLRIDFAHKIGGLRINDWVSVVVFLVATFFLLRPGGSRPEEAGYQSAMDENATTPPPDLVPGDSRQPSNQPIDEEVEGIVSQQNTGGDNMAGGGEWPDPKTPPQGEAPGTDEELRQEIVQRRQGSNPDA